MHIVAQCVLCNYTLSKNKTQNPIVHDSAVYPPHSRRCSRSIVLVSVSDSNVVEEARNGIESKIVAEFAIAAILVL